MKKEDKKKMPLTVKELTKERQLTLLCSRGALKEEHKRRKKYHGLKARLEGNTIPGGNSQNLKLNVLPP